MLRCLVFATTMLFLAPALAEPIPAPLLRLYTLDCGRIDFTNMKVFSDTGEHDGETGVMPVSCFLIRHGDDWMLWDAGLGDEIAQSPAGRIMAGLRFRVPKTLRLQLAELGLRPDDIRYVGLSHLHADHSGNARLFPNTTFLVSPKELAWAGALPTPEGVLADRVAAVKRAHILAVVGDHDVFGDGTVTMLSTPGHTVGHHCLLLKLRRSGALILSGDVAHFQVNYDQALVPTGNASRADTIAAIGRVRGIARHAHARVIIQHGADIFSQLPSSPAYLD